MSGRNFRELLEARWAEGKFVCVGLDSDLDKIPAGVRRLHSDGEIDVFETQATFNCRIVGATYDLALAYKPNAAFYLAHGDAGLAALHRSIAEIRAIAPAVPVILDAKWADIGSTNLGYCQAAFEWLGADAVTVHPYLGQEALRPFLDLKNKGVIVLCRTSNPGAGEFQDLSIQIRTERLREVLRRAFGGIPDGDIPLYQYVAYRIAEHWNAAGNCSVVVGATYPEELSRVRQLVDTLPILIPGVGFQQKGVPLETQVEQVVRNGRNPDGAGMIINSSRGIIFASDGPDFAEAARRETEKLHDLITRVLEQGLNFEPVPSS